MEENRRSTYRISEAARELGISIEWLSGPIQKFFDAPYRSCKTEEDKDFAGNLIAHTRESINEIELRTT